jgi:hypothetical protein
MALLEEAAHTAAPSNFPRQPSLRALLGISSSHHPGTDS